MIVKQVKGRGARGLMNYQFADHDMNGEVRPRADIVGGTLSGTTPRELAQEFGALKDLRPKLGVHIAHVSLRKHPEDRSLSDEEWAEIGKTWADHMGFESYVTVCHGDHVHIAASRIRLDGSVVSDSNDYKRSEEARTQIEKDFNLIQVPPSHLNDPARASTHRRAPSMAEISQAERGEVPVRQLIADAIDAALADEDGTEITASQFIEGLEDCGITVRPNIASTGRLNGFSYEMDRKAVTSRQLGRGYTLKNLEKKGLSYDKDRDAAFLRSRTSRSTDSSPEARHEKPGAPKTGAGDPDFDGSRRPAGGIPGAHRGNSGRPPSTVSPSQPSPAQDGSGGRKNPISRPGSSGGGHGGGQPALPDRTSLPRIVRGNDHPDDLNDGRYLDDDEGGSIEPSNTRKQEYKAKLWAILYNQELPTTLRGQLRFVDQDRRIIALNDGARVTDSGNRITTTKASDAAVSLMVQEATAKKWKKVAITGNQAFKEKAARECARSGLPVKNRELQHIAEDEKKKMKAREPAPGTHRWNLAAAAGTPAAGKGKLDATDRNMARQMDALNCDELEWQAIPPKGDTRNPSPLRTGSRADLEKSKSWLRRLNRDGLDIYVRPSAAEEAASGLAFIDDISLDTADRMYRDGLPVACLIESSPGNFQGWVRVSDTPMTSAEIKEVNKRLAERYGGDLGAATSRRFGRLAGFTNRKPSRTQPNRLPPYARVESVHDGVAPKGPELVAEVRAEMKEADRQAEEANTFPVPRPRPRRQKTKAPQDPITTFQRARDRAAARTDDESALDFSGTLSLVRRGHSDSEIADAIRAARPGLDTKKNGNAEQYISRTIQRAREIAAEQHQPAPSPRT